MAAGRSAQNTSAWLVEERGEGRPFGFVLFVQSTGQKQGEGEWAERRESTLITATGHHPREAKEAERNQPYHTGYSYIITRKHQAKKGKIRLGKRKKAQGSTEVATQLSSPETEAKPHTGDAQPRAGQQGSDGSWHKQARRIHFYWLFDGA